MVEIIDSILNHLDLMLLIFVRITALMMSSPIFGRRAIPNQAKIGLCAILTYIVFLTYPMEQVLLYNNILVFAAAILKELLFGLVLGYVTTAFFSLVQTAGYVIDMQMGFGMVNVFDVQSNISVPVTGNLLNLMMLMTFFGTDGHLLLIKLLMGTFATIPAGGVLLTTDIVVVALEVFSKTFVLALSVAMPLIASGLLGELVMGMMIRTVPQMNMFVVGIPLKIIMGLAMLLIVVPIYARFTHVIFEDMFLAIESIFSALVVR